MNISFDWLHSIDEALGLSIVDLYNDAISTTSIIGYTEPLDVVAGSQLIDGLRRQLSEGDISLMAIRSADDVIGMALLSASSMPNCRHIANLSKGIIRSDRRSGGVLRQAFASIAQHCEGRGHELITLDVREHSEPASIWSSLGFMPYGRLDDYARVDGVPQSGIFMAQRTSELKARLIAAPTSRPSVALLDKNEFKARLRDELESRITMTHPIVRSLVSGEPKWDLLRYMTLQGYQLTKNFLEYIETLYHHCPRGVHKRRLLLNMYEEETGRFSRTDNHVTLMENFVRAIGISDADREAAVALPSTRELIDYRMNLVRNRYTFHMGAAAVMIASEGQNLETTAGEARHDLLPRMYGLTETDLQFFSVHQKEDVGHVKEGISLVADICDSPRMQQEALEAVRRTCDLFYGMYDGVAAVFAQ